MSDTPPPAMHVDVEEALAKLGVPIPEPIELPVDENKNVVVEAGIDVVSGRPSTGTTITIKNNLPINKEDIMAEVNRITKATGNPKDAIGDTKPDISLVPAAGILLEAQAMMDGARKYGPYNWRENPVRMRVYIAAAMRHLQQLLDREDIDPLSDVYHIGHARACLGILADATFVGNLIDDRPLPGPAGTMIRRFGEKRSFKPE